MPLQNRVDPFGALSADSARGLFMGNRGGRLHRDGALGRSRWTSRQWICCVLAFKGRQRQVWGDSYTELFFLDEVTALSAGHRPCFYCRLERAADFVGRFGDAFGIAEPRAPMLDKRLHKERLASGGTPSPLSAADLAALPDGTMVAHGDKAYALRGAIALPWSFAGYGKAVDPAALAGSRLALLTPPTTVAVLRQGYRPAWHPSAEWRPVDSAATSTAGRQARTPGR